MNDQEIANEIRANLKKELPLAVFSVTVSGNAVQVLWIGGDKYTDRFPTQTDALKAQTEIIRRTIPTFCVESIGDTAWD